MMGPMAFRVQTKSQSNRVSVVVETAEEALAKIAEFAELGYDVVVRDMLVLSLMQPLWQWGNRRRNHQASS